MNPDFSIHSQYQSIYKCITQTAENRPAEPAIIELRKSGKKRSITWSLLHQSVNRMAHHLKDHKVTVKSRVVIALPNSISAVIATLGAWRLGSCVFFLSYQLTPSEQENLLEQIKPDLILAAWKNTSYPVIPITDQTIIKLENGGEELPDIVSVPCRATATGGSTGIPKIIIEEVAMHYGESDFSRWSEITGQVTGQTQLICGSLHHALFNNSFYIALAMGNRIILTDKFDEYSILAAIEKYKVNSIVLVPTMMALIAKCPKLSDTDLSSISCMHHAGASCPVWLKKKWIDMIGAEKVHEFYSMSEKVGLTHIRGDEWLLHEGSVGKPLSGEIKILDDEQNPVETGTVGNIYFVCTVPFHTHYLDGAHKMMKSRIYDNAISMGDLGYLDQGRYLYLVDRRCDMIISGGKNVYAAEVENTLREYSGVKDIVVIGLSDPHWGRRVHALIQPSCAPEDFDIYGFASFGFRNICNFKLPKTIELVDSLPRSEVGKLRRKALIEERENTKDAASVFHYISFPNGHQLNAWNAKRQRAKRLSKQQKKGVPS